MLAAAVRPGQVWLWAARQEGDPAGIPAGVGVWRLQPTWLRVWLCRPSPFAQTRAASPPTTATLVPLEGSMREIHFVDEEAEDGSFRASAAAAAIHTEAGTTGLETPQH